MTLIIYFWHHPIYLAVQLTGGLLLLRSVYLAGPHGRRNTIRPWALLIAGQAVMLAYMGLTGQVGFLPWNVGMILIGAGHLRTVLADRHRV